MTAKAEALRIARKLTALPEPAMRQRVLIEFLEHAVPGEAVEVFHEIYINGVKGGPPFNIALLTLAKTLSSGVLDYEQQARLYAEAKEGGFNSLAQLFYTGREEPEPTRVDEDQELTLGHRKWMARTGKREVLERLMRFPEPEVIRNLLVNPMVTERDVVTLAAKRPAKPAVQREIFAARKWIARYAVKRALILNPYTPTDVSLRMLSFLKRQDLHLIETSPSMPQALRDAASQLMAEIENKKE
jgi:hypothetical protein